MAALHQETVSFFRLPESLEGLLQFPLNLLALGNINKDSLYCLFPEVVYVAPVDQGSEGGCRLS